jgi:hypothetical protein
MLPNRELDLLTDLEISQDPEDTTPGYLSVCSFDRRVGFDYVWNQS